MKKELLIKLVGLQGFYKVSRMIQAMYDNDQISMHQAKWAMRVMRNAYIREFGDLPQWLILA
jgi:hypothetical protein